MITGAALAGAKAAEQLRTEGFDGRVVLIGDEPELPYERPPLTKEYLRGELPRAKTLVHDADFYDSRQIELITGVRVSAIEPSERRVVTSDGRSVGYDRVLIATGAEPRRLRIPGADLDGVHSLRTLADSDALRDRLNAGGRTVVVGAGWIGAEFAASARQLGLEVTVVDPLQVPLERVLGRELGRFYAGLHERNGVELRTGTGVDAFEGDASVTGVRTTDGRSIACDFVVVGVGVSPRTAIGEVAGARVDNGIVVDARLETSVRGVFAAGDVANAWHPFFQRHVRVEHWANALNQGSAAARAMLGLEVSYDRIPYFFSDQYDVGMEYSGLAGVDDELVIRGDRDRREFIAFWLREGRVVAGMNVNVWDVNEHVQALIRSRRPVDPAALRDKDTPLESLLAAEVEAGA